MTRTSAALTLIAMLSAGTALAAPASETASAGDRTTWIRVSCSQYGALVYSDEKSADDAAATSDWRETISRSFPKAICVTARRLGGLDTKYKPFGTLPSVLPPPEPPPPEPVAPPPPTAARISQGEQAPVALPLQSPGTPGAPVDDASLRAALSAIGMSRGKPAQRAPSMPPAPVPAPPAEPSAATSEPAATSAAKAASVPAQPVETVAFADGQDYATGGFIVSDENPVERRGTGRRTVLAGMVFAEPGQASGFVDPGMTTGGVMVAEVEPVVRIETVAAAAVLPEQPSEQPSPKAEATPQPNVMVQIASFAGWERNRMQGVWRHLSSKAAALTGLEPRIVKVGGSRVYTALRIGPLDETAARDLARTLGEKGLEARMLTGASPAMVAMAGDVQN